MPQKVTHTTCLKAWIDITNHYGRRTYMRHVTLEEQLRSENRLLREQAERTTANLDYIAMMCDIDLESEGEDEEVNDDEA